MKRSVLISVIVLAGAPAFAAQSAPAAHPPGHQMHPAKEEPASAGMEHSAHCGVPMGEGVISAVDVAKSKATIAHEPIAALGWDKMTMSFAVGKGVDLTAFAAGDRVHFLLAPGKNAKSQDIAAMCAADAEAGAHEACMGAMHKTAMKIAAAAGKPCEGMDAGMDHGAMDHGAMGHGTEGKPQDGDAKPAAGHSQH